jgi:hypothetical protein
LTRRDREVLRENAHKLRQVLEIALEQRSLLARGDLEGIQAMQATRQQLLQGIQSLDGDDGEEMATVSKILEADQAIRLLLASELTGIKRKMQKVRAVKKLIHTRRSSRKGAPRYVSRRI